MRAAARRPAGLRYAFSTPHATVSGSSNASIFNVGGPLDTFTRSYNETHTSFGSVGMATKVKENARPIMRFSSVEKRRRFSQVTMKSHFFLSPSLSLARAGSIDGREESCRSAVAAVAGSTCCLAGIINFFGTSTLSATTE